MERSKRCGKGNCPFYDKNNKASGCLKYTDRNDCSISNRHRKKAGQKSKKRAEQFS